MKWTWRGLFTKLPLPMLALAASYGVWSFNMLFLPFIFAIISAAAFELVYIGLTVADVAKESRRRATVIAGSAVLVSIVYNSLSGLFHIRPALLIDRPLVFDVALAVLHGLPLALLAFFVADLLLHKSVEVKQATSELEAMLLAPQAIYARPQAAPQASTAMLADTPHPPQASTATPASSDPLWPAKVAVWDARAASPATSWRELSIAHGRSPATLRGWWGQVEAAHTASEEEV